MSTRRTGLVGSVLIAAMVAFASVAWACVPGHDHSAGGAGEGTGTSASGSSDTPVASASSASGTPALPSATSQSPSASSPVTGAGMFNDPAPAASGSASNGGQQLAGVGLLAAGGALLVGGVASVVGARRPKRRPAVARR